MTRLKMYSGAPSSRQTKSDDASSSSRPADRSNDPWTAALKHRSPEKWVPKNPKDVEKICIKRLEISFFPIDQERDQFFQEAFSELCVDIFNLAKEVFAGDGNLPKNQSAWVPEYPQEFYEYVKAVARPDPHAEHWEGLLGNKAERIFLIQGIIMKVLDVEIFSSLLFGASDKHEKALMAHDVNLLSVDGLERSYHRALTNYTYLDMTAGVPPLFWEKVKNITTQIVVMLLPLYNVVGQASPMEGVPLLGNYVQKLHNIVTYAGWLAVLARISGDITAFEWLPPGDDYSVGQVNLLQEVFEHSKEAARAHDRRHGNAHQQRVGRVKIVTCPAITRYYVPCIDAGQDSKSGEGYVEYKVLRPHVVYYHGLPSTHENDGTIFPLSEYIRAVRRRPRGALGWKAAFWLLVFFVLCNPLAIRIDSWDSWLESWSENGPVRPLDDRATPLDRANWLLDYRLRPLSTRNDNSSPTRDRTFTTNDHGY